MSDKVKRPNLSDDEISKVSGGVNWKSGLKIVGGAAIIAAIAFVACKKRKRNSITSAVNVMKEIEKGFDCSNDF